MTKVAQALKRLLNGDELLMVPTCFDALSARLAYEAGFPVGFMSGAAVSATRLGMPDTGLIGLVELSDQLRNICSAIPGQPVAGAVQAPRTRLAPKISLIFWGSFDPVSDIKLIRTDTTL